RHTDRAVWAVLAGMALGLLAVVRQLDALIAALALGLTAIGIGGKRLRPTATAGLVLGSMAVAALLLPYNAHFTGRGSRFPIMEYNDRYYAPGSNDYGFGANRGMGWGLDPRPGHDVIDGLINTNLNLTATQVELFGWGAGSLVFLLVHLLRGRFERADRALTGLTVIVWAAYFANYFSGGPDFGARYWYLALPALIALTARGIHTFDTITGLAQRKGTVMAVIASLIAIVVFVPWRATDKYHGFRGMRADVRTLAASHGFGRAIVYGLNHMRGDAVVIMMADASDSPTDAVRYWRLLGEGYECAFGSRFIRGGNVVDYPRVKLIVNRLANLFIRVLFRHGLNDTTNAFKAYR
ncbi:MAG: glycosyltransferase family 2 protein, partial [Devosia sp.]